MFFLKAKKFSAIKLLGVVMVASLLFAACDTALSTETGQAGLGTQATDEGIPVTGGETGTSTDEGIPVTGQETGTGTDEITGTGTSAMGTDTTGTSAVGTDTTGTSTTGTGTQTGMTGTGTPAVGTGTSEAGTDTTGTSTTGTGTQTTGTTTTGTQTTGTSTTGTETSTTGTGTQTSGTGTQTGMTTGTVTTGTSQAGIAVTGDISGPLNVLGFSLGDEIATTRVDEFESKYPNVDLTLAEGALDDQQLLTAIASGNPPDVVYMSRDVLSTYASRGALLPLEDCITSQNIDMSMYRDEAVKEVTVNGQVYGIPEFYNVVVLIVNNQALDEAGLTVDDIDISDWDSLSALNDQLTVMDNGELTRIGVDPKLPEFLPLWVAANGGQMISEDGKTAMLNSPEVVQALEFTAGLQEAAGGNADFMAFRDTWDLFGANNQVVANQIAVFPMEQWYLNVLVENSPDVEITVLPFQDREGNDISYATGNAWAIPAGAENVDAACAFMKTMTATETWQMAAQARADARDADGVLFTGTYTANEQADNIIFNDIMQSTDSDMWDSALEVVKTAQENAITMPANAAGAEFKQAWQDAVTRVLSGEQTAQEALDQAQEEAQAALDAVNQGQTGTGTSGTDTGTNTGTGTGTNTGTGTGTNTGTGTGTNAGTGTDTWTIVTPTP